MATVWDPAGSYDGSFFATSPDGLKAWMTGSGAGYFLLASKTMTWNTGKYYWEVVWTGSLGQSQTGMAVPGAMGASFSGNWRYEILSGTNPVLRSLRPSTGSAGTTIALGASMLAAPGDVLMFAYDSVASKLWLGLNGSWYNGGDPAAGTGATQSVDGGYDFLPFVAFSLQGELSQAATIAPQTTAYSAPSGFSTLDLPPPDVALPSFSYSLNVLDKAPAQFSEEYRLSAKELRQGVLADRWSIPGNAIWTPVVTAVHYRLTLRQAGHEDLELPMQSFQSRIRQGRPSFLEVYVPGVLDFLAGITDRADGELVIEMGSRKTDGTTDILEIARVNLEEVRYDRGPVSATGTLTGHKTQTFAGGKTVTLSDVELVSSATNLRVRTRVSNDILPGDEIHAGGVSFTVDVIQHIVSTSQAYMELSDG
jgi:hypothetical protein